jgi:hypothetical protein
VGRTGSSPVRTMSSSGTDSCWARCNKWVSAWYGVVITVSLLSYVAVPSVLELHSVGVLMLALPEAHCQALHLPRPVLSLTQGYTIGGVGYNN